MLGLAACNDDDSALSLATDELYPHFTVETDADGMSLLSAQFENAESGEMVRLDGGDTIEVYSGEDLSVELDRDGRVYIGSLDAGNAEDTPFRFDLSRNLHNNAHNSEGTLPAPMTLSAPESGAEYSIAEDQIVVQWAPILSGDDMVIALDAVCAADDSLSTELDIELDADLGLRTINLSDYADEFDASCEAYDTVISLMRSREGTVEGVYAEAPDCDEAPCEGPSFVLTQLRSVDVVLLP